MNSAGVAIVGLGNAAIPHCRSLLDLADRSHVRWAIGRSEERINAFADAFSFPTSRTLTDALTDPKVRVVLILTPPHTHGEIAEAAFDAGKDVLVEKPLEITLERAERLVGAARKHRCCLGVVLQHRFRPSSLRLREVVANGSLGTIEAASLRVPWWRPQSYYDIEGRGTFSRDGGGVLLTQAIHAIDLFRSLLGVKEVLRSQVRTTGLHHMETEDYVSSIMTLPNGAPASLLATTCAFPGYPEALEIIGSLGFASLIGGSLKISFHDGREETVASEGKSGSGAAIMDFPHDAHRALIADYLDAARDGRDPLVTGEEALATQKLIAQIIRADPTNRQPV